MNKQDKKLFYDLMNFYEFEIYENDNGKLQVNDLQGACLGDICSEQFKNEWDILDRMEIYHQDYILRGLEEKYDRVLYNYSEWVELLERENDKENEYDLAVLKLITKGGE